MKKFLSVLLTMAMVMSLFTGTVLAAPSLVAVAPFDTTLNGGKPLVLGTTQLVEVVKGNASATPTSDNWTITDASGNTIYLSPSKVTPAVSAVTVTAGGVTTTTYTYTYTYDLSLVNIVIPTNATQNVYNLVRAANAAKSFQVVRPMTINGSTDNPTVKLNNNFVLAGAIAGGNSNMRVALMDSGNVVYTLVPVMSDGTFSLTYKLTAVGTYHIAVNGSADTTDKYTIYKTINFEADENLRMTLTKSPVTLNQMNYVTNGNRITVELTAKADSSNLVIDKAASGSDPAVVGHEKNVVFQIKYPNGELYELVSPSSANTVTLSDGWNVYKLLNYALKKVTIGTTTAYLPGVYTVSAIMFSADQSAALTGKTKLSELKDAGAIAVRQAADVTFTVVDNLATLFSDVKLNNATSSYPLGDTAQDNVNIALTPPTGKTISKAVVTVTGPLVGGTKTHTETTAPTSFNIPIDLNGYGKVLVEGTVTYSDKTTETFKAELTSKGYIAEFAPVEVLGQVGDEVTLSAVVTTSAGVPVNNAVVTWEAYIPGTATPVAAFKEWDATDKVFKSSTTATVQINGQSAIISNGTYSQLVKLVKYADIQMSVKTTTGVGSYYSYYETKIYGDEVYTLDPIANLTATKSQTFNVVMKNASGVAVQPNFVAIDDTATPGILAVNPTTFTYDGSTGKLTVKPVKTGTFTLLVGTDSGDKMAMVDVTVVAPVATVTVNGVVSSKVTAGFRDKVVVTFADTAASVVDTTPTITASTLDGAIYNAATAGVAYAGAATENTVSGIVTFYPEYSIYKATEKGSFAINASFDGGANWVKIATLEVVHPVLSFGGVEELEVGSVVDLDLTLTDANGKALKDFDIKAVDGAAFAGNAVVTTDDEGKAVLTVSPTAVGRLSLEVQGLKSVYDNTLTAPAAVNYSAFVPVVRDTKGPVFELETVYSVNTMPATINFKVTDGSKVTEVWIGYEKAMVRPDGSVVFTVTGLPVGVTEFDVLAYDYYGNASEGTLVIEYLKPATVLLTIGSTDATKDGAAMTGMDQAPVIVNGRTFLPVRFVLVNLLGGTIEWDANTQTITSVVNGNTIKMVIGSNTAYVNGNAVALLEAPYIEATTGRTLVPMREIMEAIGVSLDWNGATQTVTITIPQ